MWVALNDSKLVGLIGLIVKGNEAEIEPVVVDKEYRRKSVGKQLVERVISEARNTGIKYLNVLPVARNLSTVGFFYRLGFVNVGKAKLFRFRRQELEARLETRRIRI